MEETTSNDSLHTPPPPTYIPLDIIPETILCRLPVKSLLRFRCVCNSWDSLISKDLKFAKKHLRVSPKRQHLVTTTWRIAELLTVMSYPFDSLSLHSTFDSKGTQLDYSPIIPDNRNGLIASCDGLLCFIIDNRFAALYNPSIKKVKKLPCIDLPRKKGSTLFAFGYDPFIDNYKVVAVFWYKYDVISFGNFKTQANVYSYTLGTNSWRRIKDLPFMLYFRGYKMSKHGIFASGTVNWLAYHLSNENSIVSSHAIISLHLGKESYQEIPQPDYGNSKMLTLDVMRDCLCLFSQESPKSSTHVWLMKEYGNKESWIKLICLPCYDDFSHVFITDIVYISKDDNHVLVVFIGNREFMWVVYDIKNDTIKSSKIQDNLGLEKSKVYVESLISP
ncbi:F-box/kelch-repeat protein [Trifolium repens]|nr:F-box/kelch-repeat protein [Trifolium repens]